MFTTPHLHQYIVAYSKAHYFNFYVFISFQILSSSTYATCHTIKNSFFLQRYRYSKSKVEHINYRLENVIWFVLLFLNSSIAKLEDFSAYKAAIGFEAISQYANNLFTKPWRKEYKVIKVRTIRSVLILTQFRIIPTYIYFLDVLWILPARNCGQSDRCGSAFRTDGLPNDAKPNVGSRGTHLSRSGYQRFQGCHYG